jgi:hypothetical protein
VNLLLSNPSNMTEHRVHPLQRIQQQGTILEAERLDHYHRRWGCRCPHHDVPLQSQRQWGHEPWTETSEIISRNKPFFLISLLSCYFVIATESWLIHVWSSNLTSGYISKRLEIRILQTYLHFHVHCIIMQNNQDKITIKSTEGWMDKEIIVYTYNGMLLSLKERDFMWLCELIRQVSRPLKL